MRQAIAITRAALRDIASHAREAWPNECCGLLIGTAARIETAHRARNLHESPTRYLLHPEDHFAAIRVARTGSLQVVGAYHSHPDGRPVPSPTDRTDAAGGGFIHLISGATRVRRAPCDARRSRAGRVSGRSELSFRDRALASGGTGARAARRARRARVPPRALHVLGQWLAAWRLVDGNFVPVALVRLP